MALVLDTGILFAALDTDDPDHDRCRELIQSSREALVIPAPVFVQLDYWIRKVAGAEAWLAFCESVAAGAYTIHQLDTRILSRAAELQTRYANISLDLVDAAVFATCEALGEKKVATLDRRDFGLLRTADGRALELLPHSR